MKSGDAKSFSISFLILKGAFCECPIDWPALREVIINGLFELVSKIRQGLVLDVPPQIPAEVANVTASVVRMGMQVGWMDKSWEKQARGNI